MRRRISWLVGGLMVLLQIAVASQRASAATAMIFMNGNMGSAGGLTTSQINGLRASGFTTMVLFTMSVQSNGDFTFSDGSTVCSGGVYLGPANWASLLAQCRVAPTGISRIEMCIAQWGDTSFANIKNRIAADGTGSGTVLYRNLQAMKNALGIDAIDYDDETIYDSGSAISFGQMCAAAGFKVTLCPYTNPGYWQAVKSGLGAICDQVYLQCYDGGAGNNPSAWNSYFGGLKVIPGYWDYERDNTFLNNLQAWKSAGGNGGFLWPSCTGCNPPADGNEMIQYATQILDTFSPTVTPVTAADVAGGQVTFTSALGGNFSTYQWQMIRSGVANNIPGATNATLTLANLQLTNTALYQLQASNTFGLSTGNASSLTVSSAPAPVNNVVTSYAGQTGLGFGFSYSPTWTLAPTSIIQGQLPNGTNGNFSLEVPGRSVKFLTAGALGAISLIAGTSGNTASTNLVTCGNGGGAGSLVIYSLTNTSAAGYNLTNITVYGGWADAGRDQQAYTVYYSKVGAPATFIWLGSVSYNPANVANAPSATRVTLASAAGWLATNVAAVEFDFTSPVSENGYCGYSQIALYGIPLAPVVTTNTLPVTAADVVGSQVTFMASFTAGSPLAYQWQVIRGGMTNNIPGATNTMLTVANLQLTNTASYQLQASNAYGIAVSAPSSLTVSSVPAAVNNVITSYAAQTGLGSAVTNFSPTWTMTPGSLIAGQLPSSVGNGDFKSPGFETAGVVAVLTDGNFGWLNYWPNVGSSPTEVTCGTVAGGAGQSVTYTLTGSASGYNLTNIIVYGGWGDAGRDQQAYTVYYSKMAAPANFVQLGSVNYNPANLTGVQSATRATLTPVNGVLATNVAAVKFDFTTPPGENGFSGYSEIELYGAPAFVMATNSTNIAIQVAANVLTLSWPGDHTGWRLQVQTNDVMQGLGTNWVDVIGATATNEFSLPINPASGSAFYRMVNP